MKLPAKFFDELLRLAHRHGIKEIGTSLIRTGDDDKAVAELVIFSDEVSDSVRAPGSAWQTQNYLESFGVPRERFPVGTDSRSIRVKVVNSRSDGHEQQLRLLGEFLGLEEIHYLDRGNGENYTFVRHDGRKMTLMVRRCWARWVPCD